MSLVTLVLRLLGRDRTPPEVTRAEVRAMIRERQERQAARLRGLDIQAGMPVRYGRRRGDVR